MRLITHSARCWAFGTTKFHGSFQRRSIVRFPCLRARNANQPSSSFDFSHIVIGGGVVGLAIARQLQLRKNTPLANPPQVLLLEKNSEIGMETSSRNSEVIHAGIYYPPSSLKSLLCRRGRDLLYQYCEENRVPYWKCGKWIVAQTDTEMEYLQGLHRTLRDGNTKNFKQNSANNLQSFPSPESLIPHASFPPTHFLSSSEAAKLEPDVKASAGVLMSPETGIIDSHCFMTQLRAQFENDGGLCVTNSGVSNVTPVPVGSGTGREKSSRKQLGQDGWEVEVQDRVSAECSRLTASVVVNAAGHGAPKISNMILPPERQVVPLYVKGTYYGYSSSSPRPTRLIYPVPSQTKSQPAAGLGTHLTLDLTGRVRFGPDIEWTNSDDDVNPSGAPDGHEDTRHTRFDAALAAIRTYLPTIQAEEVYPDYAGVRPKLAAESPLFSSGHLSASDLSSRGEDERKENGKEQTLVQEQSPPDYGPGPQPFYSDFYISAEPGYLGLVNLLGIESPGLTCSLAIGELVDEMIRTQKQERHS